MDKAIDLVLLRTSGEEQLRTYKVPSIHSEEDLLNTIRTLVNRDADYGTSVYSTSIAATATFNYLAHCKKITVFQASCADLDILRRIRGYDTGFMVIDYDKLLYPQYEDRIHGYWQYVKENLTALAQVARRLLSENHGATSSLIVDHWKKIIAMEGDTNA